MYSLHEPTEIDPGKQVKKHADQAYLLADHERPFELSEGLILSCCFCGLVVGICIA